ncbi:MAG: hypothetical protein O9352_17715, partial [Rhizobium sp.]|nr:hypothetical protein [Rhizobium sp.]
TLTQPGIRKNGGLAVIDPSPIAGEGWPSSPALLYLTKKHGNHKTSRSFLNGSSSAGAGFRQGGDDRRCTYPEVWARRSPLILAERCPEKLRAVKS